MSARRCGPASAGSPKTVVATYERSNHFGEMALLTGSPRVASVRTLTPVTALKLEKADFDGLLEKHPGMRAILERTAAERLTREATAKVLQAQGQAEGRDRAASSGEPEPQDQP